MFLVLHTFLVIYPFNLILFSDLQPFLFYLPVTIVSCFWPFIISFSLILHTVSRSLPFTLFSVTLYTLFLYPIFTFNSCLSPFITYSCSIPLIYIWFLSLTLHTLFLFVTFTFDSRLSPNILYSCSLPLHLVLVSLPTYFILYLYLYIWLLSLTFHTLF